jgi:hypothetical protein
MEVWRGDVDLRSILESLKLGLQKKCSRFKATSVREASSILFDL